MDAKLSVMEVRDKINQTEFGYIISLIELLPLINSFDDLYEIFLIGQKPGDQQIRKDEEEDIIYNKCDYVIEFFDSSYWVVYSSDEKYLSRLKVVLADKYLIEDVSE